MKIKCLFHGIFKSKAFVLIALLLGAFSCVAQNTLEKADREFNNYNYANALKLYIQLYKQKPDMVVCSRIGECYLKNNFYNQAEKWYLKALTYSPKDKNLLFKYGTVLQSNGKYKDAIGVFQKLKNKYFRNDNIELKIASCDSALKWQMETEKGFWVRNDYSHNSKFSDYSPLVLNSGFIFCSDRGKPGVKTGNNKSGWTGNAYFRPFYESKGQHKILTDSFQIVSFDTMCAHIGPVAFTPKGDTMYFTVTKKLKFIGKYSNDPTNWTSENERFIYESRLELFIAVKQGNKWGNIQPFKYNNIGEYSLGCASISPDGKKLFFASDMPGGYGASDLYYCQKDKTGNWGKPVNLGKKINTEGRETFPFIDKNNILYFSSDSHIGMGGLDIFSAKLTANGWDSLINLKSPVNSPADDIGFNFTKDKRTAYFSSNRKGGMGSDDIYLARKQFPLVLMAQTMEKNNIPLTEVDFLLITKRDSIKLRGNDKGQFFSRINRGSKYEIKAKCKNYEAATIQFSTDSIFEDTLKITLELHKIRFNEVVILKNIHFDYKKATIRKDSEEEMNKIYRLLMENPEIIVELGSHTDCRGGDLYNVNLSKMRALATVNYLKRKGISDNRLVAKWYGETQLLNNCGNNIPCSEAEHQLNRRTDFKIIGVIPDKEIITANPVTGKPD